MERAPSRIGFGLAVSLALLGIGSCAGGGRHPNTSSDCETAQDHFINVHGNSLSCDQARIAISKGHQVCWRSDRGTTLEIEFEDPSPFPDLRCHKNSCMSGAPDPNVLGSLPRSTRCRRRHSRRPRRRIPPGFTVGSSSRSKRRRTMRPARQRGRYLHEDNPGCRCYRSRSRGGCGRDTSHQRRNDDPDGSLPGSRRPRHRRPKRR
jgi:hypothetical protein